MMGERHDIGSASAVRGNRAKSRPIPPRRVVVVLMIQATCDQKNPSAVANGRSYLVGVTDGVCDGAPPTPHAF